MEMRNIGKCGMAVSVVGIGCNNFGGRSDLKESTAVIHKALDLGVTFFDTADSYPLTDCGRSEEILGKVLGPRRKDIVLATKFGLDLGPDIKGGGSRRYIISAVEQSLKRLGTDWIDLFQYHKPDPNTPIEETLGALNDLIRQGKVRYIGCSNFQAWQATEADWVARQLGMDGFVSCQNEYSLLEREPERELLNMMEKYGWGFLPFFPLASGLLTGKYTQGEEAPEGSRFAKSPIFNDLFMTEDNWRKINLLEKFARDRDHTLLELAFSWLANRPVLWSIIAGASTPEQVATNVKAVEWQLTPEDLAEIDKITDKPNPPHM